MKWLQSICADCTRSRGRRIRREWLYSVAAGVALYLIGSVFFAHLDVWIEEEKARRPLGEPLRMEVRHVIDVDSFELNLEDEMYFADQRHFWVHLAKVDPEKSRDSQWPIYLVSMEQVVCAVHSADILRELTYSAEFLEFLEGKSEAGALWLSSCAGFILYLGPNPLHRFGMDPPSEEVEAALLEFLEESDKWRRLREVSDLDI